MNVALAAREGKLSFDDPVRKFLPDVTGFTISTDRTRNLRWEKR
jgi:CubicO group peptidase (beta-lactamase class C family)